MTCPECGARFDQGALQRAQGLEEIGWVGWIVAGLAWVVVGGLGLAGAGRGGVSTMAGAFVCAMLPGGIFPALLFLWWKFSVMRWTNKQSGAYRAAVALMPWGVAALVVLVFWSMLRMS